MKPVNPTFFLHVWHRFFFFFPSGALGVLPPGLAASAPDKLESSAEAEAPASGVAALALATSVLMDSSASLFLSLLEGTITVGEPVSTEALLLLNGLVDEAEEEDCAAAPAEVEAAPEASSMQSEAMVPGVGAREAGMLLGGCCFFLTVSL